MQHRIDALKKKLQDEINEVRHELEVELPKRIDEARQKGDLSENAEYSSAKDEQRYQAVRLVQLQHRLSKLSGVNLDEIDPNTVGLYSVVDLEEVESGKLYAYELVLPEEMDIKQGMISILSPVGQQIRGAVAGQTVTVETPARTFELKVIAFTNILGVRHEG